MLEPEALEPESSTITTRPVRFEKKNTKNAVEIF